MFDITILPHLNAVLNAIAAVLLFFGFVFIRSGNRNAHKASMMAAAGVSGLFLISYVAHRFNAPIFVFPGQGGVRIFYYALLISHVSLSVVIVPLAALTLWRAATAKFPAHKRIARWTWPIWMYVSISGIAVYVMLYQLYPLDLTGH